mmetsp:Transcript_42801/g.81685  ORF Transcript_42801/g.81685 Transcript_42801/m.81685 type:complete len:394 (-) Transcript_42801:149-1330(-)
MMGGAGATLKGGTGCPNCKGGPGRPKISSRNSPATGISANVVGDATASVGLLGLLGPLATSILRTLWADSSLSLGSTKGMRWWSSRVRFTRPFTTGMSSLSEEPSPLNALPTGPCMASLSVVSTSPPTMGTLSPVVDCALTCCADSADSLSSSPTKGMGLAMIRSTMLPTIGTSSPSVLVWAEPLADSALTDCAVVGSSLSSLLPIPKGISVIAGGPGWPKSRGGPGVPSSLETSPPTTGIFAPVVGASESIEDTDSLSTNGMGLDRSLSTSPPIKGTLSPILSTETWPDDGGVCFCSSPNRRRVEAFPMLCPNPTWRPVAVKQNAHCKTKREPITAAVGWRCILYMLNRDVTSLWLRATWLSSSTLTRLQVEKLWLADTIPKHAHNIPAGRD